MAVNTLSDGGGRVLALFEGGAAGDVALRDAVREAQRRNAMIDVFGFVPCSFLTPFAFGGFFALWVAPCLDRRRELADELQAAMGRVPPDLSVRFCVVRGDPLVQLDLGDYVVVTGRRNESWLARWLRRAYG